MIKYSIIIPTCNGGKKLNKCLDHIAKLNKPQNNYEVLVIDNASNDNTAEIAKSFSFVEYFYEEQPGLHHSRNRGIKEATGEIIAFIDDDSFVHNNWLVGIEETFRNKDAVIAGGPCIPHYESTPPGWLKYFWIYDSFGKYLWQLSITDFGNKPKMIPTNYVFGCNFIVKKDVLFKYKGFHPDCMPKDLVLFYGDGETYISSQLNKNSVKAYYNPKIKHLCSTSRITKEYFKVRFFNEGITNSYTQTRLKHGFYEKDDFDFYKNFDIKPKKKLFWLRKYEKIDKSYKEYLEIKNSCEQAYSEGYKYHENEMKNDPKLLEYVVKENYFD